jgi:predicted DNA-binding protein
MDDLVLINLKIPRDMRDRLRQRSEDTGSSMAWAIRKAIDLFLREEEEASKSRKRKERATP